MMHILEWVFGISIFINVLQWIWWKRQVAWWTNENDRLRRIQARAEKYLSEMDEVDQKENRDLVSEKWKHGQCFQCDITYEPRFIGRMCVKCCKTIVGIKRKKESLRQYGPAKKVKS